MEAPRELLALEDVTFSEEWHLLGVAMQVRGAKAALCLWLCMHCPQAAPWEGAWEGCIPCIPAACMGQVCWCHALLGRTCLLQQSHHGVGQTSSEQDNTSFDPPALILMCFSSQTVPVKAFFLLTFTVFPPPVPESFHSTQWGFGWFFAEAETKWNGNQSQLCQSQSEFNASLTGQNLVTCSMCQNDTLATPLPLSLGNLWALSWPLGHFALPLLVLYFLPRSFKTLSEPKLFFYITYSLFDFKDGREVI